MSTLHSFTVHADFPDNTHFIEAEKVIAHAVAAALHDAGIPGNVTVTNTHIDSASEVTKIADVHGRTGTAVIR
jgi:hypothetical protein